MHKEFRWLIAEIDGWVLTCESVVWLTIRWFPFEPTFPYYHELLAHFGSRLITTWLNFDEVHDLTIVLKGYVGTGLIQAFFPLHPMLLILFDSANKILLDWDCWLHEDYPLSRWYYPN